MSCFIFNWLIYYSSIITSMGLHVSCYTAPIFNYMTFFKFYLLLMCNIIFYMCMSQMTSSHFARYFYDTYSEYITPCTIMTYTTSNAMRVMPPWLCTLRSRAMVSSMSVPSDLPPQGCGHHASVATHPMHLIA
jgi:hypothetical protein